MKRPTLHVLKIGGKLLADEARLHQLLATFAELEGAKILVHGGGTKADTLCRQLGIVPNMVEGRRITDEPTLEVVTMVYAGLVNKQMVAYLQANHCNALGLSGADGNIITTRKRPQKGDIDYGLVGDVVAVNTGFFNNLLSQQITPVCCAITHDAHGQLLNTNADTVAATVAAALTHKYDVQLLFCLEKNGVLLDAENKNTVIPTITPANYQKLKNKGIITKGMIPKLDNAFDALKKGVSYVVIGNPDTIFNGKGTILCE